MAAKESVLRPLGLTVPQYSALLLLREAPGLSSAALARRALVKPQTMGPLIEGMERKGLVERRPHRDHERMIEIVLTPPGKALLRKADRAALAVEDELAALLTKAEQQALRELLSKAIGGLRGDPASQN